MLNGHTITGAMPHRLLARGVKGLALAGLLGLAPIAASSAATTDAGNAGIEPAASAAVIEMVPVLPSTDVTVPAAVIDEPAASAPQEGVPEFGPDGRIYPGTCRGRAYADRLPSDALRYDLSKTVGPHMPTFTETGPAHAGAHEVTAEHLLTHVGDPILARPGMVASYHFAVILDDAQSGVTHVIRGEDLFEATFLQRFLQWELGLLPPLYHHHRLIRDASGKRLAKRDDARAISTCRAEGASPGDIRKMVGL